MKALVCSTLLAFLWASAPANAQLVVFDRGVIATNNTEARAVSAADLDGDGDVDLMTASPGDNTLRWYESDGQRSPTFIEHVLDTDRRRPNFVVGIDIDRDGKLDILTCSSLDDTISWYRNLGGNPVTFVEVVISEDADGQPEQGDEGFADGVRQIFYADFDDDGDWDVCAASPEDNTVSWFRNLDGAGQQWEAIEIATDLLGARAIYAADLDGDGDPDIAAGGWEEDTIAWYDNDGMNPPSFTERVVVATPGLQVVWSLHADDVDADGDIDVLATVRNRNKVAWYENDGASVPTFTEHVITETALSARSVFTSDLDRDGDMDVMSASHFDSDINWYESDGGTPPGFTQHTVYGDALQARSVYAADVNGDGYDDILSAAKTLNEIAWYESRRPCPPDVAAPFQVLDVFDALEYLARFDAGDHGADWEPPYGELDVFDLLAFLDALGAGCPITGQGP